MRTSVVPTTEKSGLAAQIDRVAEDVELVVIEDSRRRPVEHARRALLVGKEGGVRRPPVEFDAPGRLARAIVDADAAVDEAPAVANAIVRTIGRRARVPVAVRIPHAQLAAVRTAREEEREVEPNDRKFWRKVRTEYRKIDHAQNGILSMHDLTVYLEANNVHDWLNRHFYSFLKREHDRLDGLHEREHHHLSGTCTTTRIYMSFNMHGYDRPFKLKGVIVYRNRMGVGVEFKDVRPYIEQMLGALVNRLKG